MRAKFGEETPTAWKVKIRLTSRGGGKLVKQINKAKRPNTKSSVIIRCGKHAVPETDIIAADQPIGSGPQKTRHDRRNDDFHQYTRSLRRAAPAAAGVRLRHRPRANGQDGEQRRPPDDHK